MALIVSGAAFISESDEFVAESADTAVLAEEGAELSAPVDPVLEAELQAIARTPAAKRQKKVFFMLMGYFFLKYIRIGTPLKSNCSLNWFSR